MLQKLFAVLLSLTAIFSLQAQEKKSISKINGIEISGKIIMEIQRSDNYTLEMKYKGIDSTCIDMNIENGILKMDLIKGSHCKGEVIAILTCPTLKSIKLAGRADVTTSNVIVGDKLEIEMKSSSSALVDMDIKQLNAQLSGGAILRSEGYATNQTIKAVTSSTFSGTTLEGDHINAESLSNSKIKVYANKRIDAKARAGAYIGYVGTPSIKNIDEGSNGLIVDEEENENN